MTGTTIDCKMGRDGHKAQRNDDGDLLVYAEHDGTYKPACAEHSGVCHEECWPAERHPELRARTPAKEATAP